MQLDRQSPTDEQLRDAYPELWAWYGSRYPKKDQPRRSLLMLEFVRRFSQLCLLAKEPSLRRMWVRTEDPTDITIEIARAIKILYRPGTEVQTFLRLDSELDELLSYLDPPSPERRIQDLAEELDRRDFSVGEIFGLIPRLTTRLAGRPVTKRVEAVVAAEMWDAGLSWTRIAQKLHGCKDSADCFRHRERIRKAVKSLDKFFAEFEIPIPKRRRRS